MIHPRGALIIVEGGDRCGKTTFCKGLVAGLLAKNIKAEYMNFPDRTTKIGKRINEYLSTKDTDYNDETIHLLFSANRWELAPKMKALLSAGTTLIVDRYAYSGVAFSAAKGLDVNWCRHPDVGLPKPDRVYLMKLDPDIQASREGFGDERYETTNFQKKVFSCYLQMEEPYWQSLNASKPTEELQNEEITSVMSLVKEVQNTHIGQLWKESH